jgi:hypothetical protein
MNAAFNPQNKRFQVISKLMFSLRLIQHLLDNLEAVVEVLPQKQNVDDPVHLVLRINRSQD